MPMPIWAVENLNIFTNIYENKILLNHTKTDRTDSSNMWQVNGPILSLKF